MGTDKDAGQMQRAGQAVNRLRDTEPEAWKRPDCTVGPGTHRKQHIRAPASGAASRDLRAPGSGAEFWGLRAEGACPGGQPAGRQGEQSPGSGASRRAGRS